MSNLKYVSTAQGVVVAAGDQAAVAFGNLPDINWPLFSVLIVLNYL